MVSPGVLKGGAVFRVGVLYVLREVACYSVCQEWGLDGLKIPVWTAAELQGVPNVILTPHIGGSTEEAQAAIGREVAAALVKCVNTGTTAGAVNFPQVRTRLSNAQRSAAGESSLFCGG